MGDGELTEVQLESTLEEALGASPEFVGRNAFLSDSFRGANPLDLRALLARAFGLDLKRAEAARLADLATEREVEAKELGRLIRSEAKEIGRIEIEKIAADEAVRTAEATLAATRVKLAEVEATRETSSCAMRPAPTGWLSGSNRWSPCWSQRGSSYPMSPRGGFSRPLRRLWTAKRWRSPNRSPGRLRSRSHRFDRGSSGRAGDGGC